MQTEKEYLFEVWQTLDAINRSTDEKRKQEIKNYLHQKVYPRKHRYGFSSIENVHKSVNYLRAGKEDPTRKQRYDRLRETIKTLKEVVSAYEKEQERGNTPLKTKGFTLHYDRLKDQQAHRDKGNSLDYRDRD